MPVTAPERYAFFSVHDISAIGSFAMVLSEQYQIVSTGETAATIEAAGTPVQRVEEFLGDGALSAELAAMSDPDAKVDLLEVRMRRHLSQPLASFKASGRAAVELAYINPTPPYLQPAKAGTFAGIFLDPRLDMVRAAINGGRDIVTCPGQMLEFLTGLPEADPSSQRINRAMEASAYMERLFSDARSFGHVALDARPRAQ